MVILERDAKQLANEIGCSIIEAANALTRCNYNYIDARSYLMQKYNK